MTPEVVDGGFSAMTVAALGLDDGRQQTNAPLSLAKNRWSRLVGGDDLIGIPLLGEEELAVAGELFLEGVA